MRLNYASNSNSEILRREITFSRLALSLARDYSSVYYVSMEDNSYVEYAAMGDGERLNILSEGVDFFEDMTSTCRKLVYVEDRDRFMSHINKASFEHVIQTGETFTMDYRLVLGGIPMYYQMKATQGAGSDDEYIVLGVRNIDNQVRREKESESTNKTYSQIAYALASRYEVVYYVDLVTNEYNEYTTSEKYAQLQNSNHGDNFFADTQKNIKTTIYAEDRDRVALEMQKERFLLELAKVSTYSLTYRLMLDGKPQYVNLRAIRPTEDDRHAIIGVSNIDDSMKREIEYKNVMRMATSDALTGVKNKHGYLSIEQEINDAIKSDDEEKPEFAIAVCDVNDLKKVNDLLGHSAGDEYIRSACKLICNIFKHSPVFRVGGDEFAVILTGDDYTNRQALANAVKIASLDNKKHGQVVVACGMAEFDPKLDYYVSDVFNRADNAMYEDKKALKRPMWNMPILT